MKSIEELKRPIDVLKTSDYLSDKFTNFIGKVFNLIFGTVVRLQNDPSYRDAYLDTIIPETSKFILEIGFQKINIPDKKVKAEFGYKVSNDLKAYLYETDNQFSSMGVLLSQNKYNKDVNPIKRIIQKIVRKFLYMSISDIRLYNLPDCPLPDSDLKTSILLLL